MGKGLQMMFKALGVEIAPEHIAMIQALIPQLPAKINEAAQAINGALANFDARLRALELSNKIFLEALQILRHDIFALVDKQVEELREVVNGHTGRITDAPRSTARSSGSGSCRAGGAGGDGAGNGGGSNDASG